MGFIGIAKELTDEEIIEGKPARMLLLSQVPWDSYTSFTGYTPEGSAAVSVLMERSV